MLWRMNQECRRLKGVVEELRLRWAPSLALSGLCLLGVLQAGCASRPSAPTPLQQLQGTWSGVVANEPSKDRYTIRVAGDSFHFHRDTNFWFETTIQLPPGTEPQQLLATIRKCAPGQENSLNKSVVAIFKIEADTLILAARGDGADDVPTSFDNSEDKGLTRYELRRVPR
jgi:uncharacterized protein (TIGR03067 family)